jgi:tetratricopeptide (TPR) repeat protein
MAKNKTKFIGKAGQIFAMASLIISSLNCSAFFLSPEKKEIKERLAQAALLAEQEAFIEAIQAYESILKTYPDNPWGDEALFNIGCIYLFYTNPEKDFEKAQTYLERIIEEYPESPYLKPGLGMLAVLNTLKLKEDEIAAAQREIAVKEKEMDALRESIKSAQVNQFTTFIATAYELFLKEQEIETLNRKILSQQKTIALLQTQMKKIKEVDIQAEKKKSDED